MLPKDVTTYTMMFVGDPLLRVPDIWKIILCQCLRYNFVQKSVGLSYTVTHFFVLYIALFLLNCLQQDLIHDRSSWAPLTILALLRVAFTSLLNTCPEDYNYMHLHSLEPQTTILNFLDFSINMM